MVLNNHSYCHVEIRKRCKTLEQLTGMVLITNLSEEFDDLKFMNKLSYIIIDYKKEVIFAMSHKITDDELRIIRDLMIDLVWLYLGGIWQERVAKNTRKTNNVHKSLK